MKKWLLLTALVLSISGQAQKKELDHTVYDGWQTIRETSFQPQGGFIAYTINPQEGDGQLVVRQINSGKQWIIERGAQPVFTENGQYLIAKIKPRFADTRQAKIDKKKPDEMPKDSLVIIALSNAIIQKIPAVKTFQVPEKGSQYIAYTKDKKGDVSKEGTDLLVRNLESGKEKMFSNISSFSIHPKGLYVAISQLKTKTSTAQILWYPTSDTIAKTINQKFYSMTGFSWDEEGNQLAYFIEKDSSDKALQKNYSLAYYTPSMDSAHWVVDRTNPVIPAKYTIGGDRKITFSKSGKVIQLGIQPIIPIKDTSLPEFERVSVDVWHYDEPSLQSMQQKNVDNTLKSTEAIIYRPENKSVTYLGKIKDRDIITTQEGDGLMAYALIDSSDQVAYQWQGYSLKDIYGINTVTAQKSLIQKSFKGNLVTASPNGQYLVYYDEIQKKYNSFSTIDQKKTFIGKDIHTILYDEENDMPDDPNAYGFVKWMDNNEQFIIYDKYDLWLVDAKGVKPSVALTNGRKDKIVYRFTETDPDRTAFKNNAILLLKGFYETDKSESIARFELESKKLFVIQHLGMHLTTLVAAKKSDDIALLQEDEIQSPNVYLYQFENKLQSPKPISAINPQQSQYNWMTSQLVKWKAYTGKTAEGVLYLPENFNAKEKYPMIVYFYERNNQTLHNYLAPAPTPSRLNIPFFVSRGYVVFVPDIWYQKGYPGQGAYDYILSGTRAMVQKGFIDSTKIGLQGQSWGGYQIAYLITKTNLYAAAWAGAPVVNMTSAYGGIRWGTGMNRQFQYEKTQSRIGASLWERPDLYIKNSALFSLPKVTTPLVIMSNDADDAVPWYQGIEMFTAMRRLHKKVWLLVYNNEAHNLVERRNRKDIQIREQQFFDSYLKGAPQPTWLKTGVPAYMKGRTMGLEY
ncbi:MAG: S9 family peptidase [Chitinophagaceae bacterium]|nr:MAG: S9 family peptidase [Chitinophagaceae bacterium]